MAEEFIVYTYEVNYLDISLWAEIANLKGIFLHFKYFVIIIQTTK